MNRPHAINLKSLRIVDINHDTKAEIDFDYR